MKRAACITMIARQIAVRNGLVWTKLPQKLQIEYTTLAENILATVERMMVSYYWEFKL